MSAYGGGFATVPAYLAEMSVHQTSCARIIAARLLDATAGCG